MITRENLSNATFAECLDFLLFIEGVRPSGSKKKSGERWTKDEFAYAVGVNEKTVRNWLSGKPPPLSLGGIEKALFGQDKTDPLLTALRSAYNRARGAKRSQVKPVGVDQDNVPRTVLKSDGVVHHHIQAVPDFTGRKDLLDDIHQALWQDGGTAALTQPAAVRGLGGVGKSTLAQHYAWLNRERYCGVWWVRAEQADSTLPDDLIELGRELLPNLDETDRDRALRETLKEIARSGAEKPWLIVFDNAQGPNEIAPYLPRTGAKILITSRWSDWHGKATELQVEVFPPEVAADYLMERARHPDRNAASRLARDLGYLPLALSHARAYCWRANITFDDYRLRLPELIRKAPGQVDYERAVYATFDLAITELAKTCPEAERLMAIAAFLDPDRIPVRIFTSEALKGAEPSDALAALGEVSLITHETLEDGSPAFSVHRLVQEVMRRRAPQISEEIQRSYLLVANRIFDVLHRDSRYGAETLLPHVLALANHLSAQGEIAPGILNPITDYVRSDEFDPNKEGELTRLFPYIEPLLKFLESDGSNYSVPAELKADVETLVFQLSVALPSFQSSFPPGEISQEYQVILQRLVSWFGDIKLRTNNDG